MPDNNAFTGVFPVYENQFKVKVSNSYVNIADMESFSPSFDNGVEEWTPMDTEGWIKRLMTAKGITLSVSGKRNVGDSGNDHIAGLAFKNGREAQADIQWTFPDGTTVEFEDAVINVTALGAGDSTAVGPLEFDIQSNGKPTITPAV
ncbi:MAG: hypothetical protein K6G85_04420 [Eubacterium sp.]|nr:hypothetical protein [Eubacterium sp.]